MIKVVNIEFYKDGRLCSTMKCTYKKTFEFNEEKAKKIFEKENITNMSADYVTIKARSEGYIFKVE